MKKTKNLLHFIALVAFMVSSVSGVPNASAMISHHVAQAEQFSNHTDAHHTMKAGHKTVTDHSCCDDMVIDVQNPNGTKQYCAGDCQYMMNSCSKNPSLFNTNTLTYFPDIIPSFPLAHNDEHVDDNIVYLLRRPPKT